MGISNKLRVLFVGVNFILPTFTHALIIEPVKIDSSQGEPLYAEIPFHNASNQSPLQVSIAQPFELGIPEVNDPAQLSHYNFYVRQNSEGNGVIVITSSRPLHENALSLVLKINDSGQVHMQQLHQKLPSRIDRLKSSLQETPLQPRIVANEADIQLNLPESSQLTEQLLVVKQAPPPMLDQSITSTSTPITTLDHQPTDHIGLGSISANQHEGLSTTTIMSSTSSQSSIVASEIPVKTITAQSIEPIPETPLAATIQTPPKATQNTHITPAPVVNNEQKHRVQANESLWAIANRISKNQGISINTVMRDIHHNNQHAFVNGNVNRLKQGVVLNIPPSYVLPTKTTQTAKNQAKIASTKTPSTVAKTTPEPNKQNNAHMSIVANTNQGTIQGAGKTEGENNAPQHELSIKLKQARSNSLTLQNNVRQLDQQLKQKEKRIALLNARLAELEQILKSREAQKSQNADLPNTTSKSQGVIPAIIAGTLVAVSAINSNSVIATLLQELI